MAIQTPFLTKNGHLQRKGGRPLLWTNKATQLDVDMVQVSSTQLGWLSKLVKLQVQKMSDHSNPLRVVYIYIYR